MATVQANCRACRSDVDEFKAHTAWIDVDDNSAIAGFNNSGPNHAAANYRSVKVISGFMTHFFL